MLNRYRVLVFVVVALGSVPAARGQEATEIYIPIGRSPGISDKSSVIGSLETVDAKRRMLTVSTPAGARSVAFTARTTVWLDRSLQKQPNQTGAFSDLQPGRRVEVKLRKGDPNPVAEWIKVQVAGVKP